MIGYALWHLIQLALFVAWLRHPKRTRGPWPFGLWNEVLQESNRYRKRGKSRKKRLRNILDGFQESTNALPDATVVMGADWKIEWANPASKTMLGINKPTGVYGDIFQYIDDSEFREYVETGDFSKSLQIPATFDASSTLEIRVVEYGKGKHLLQARDITRLYQLENVRRDFVANVSHELRTPLTVVAGYLETILDADEDDELQDWKPILGLMNQQSARLQHIVDDLLILSRLETRDRSRGMEVVDAPSIIESVVEDARALTTPDEHNITYECEPGLFLIANASELQSAFSNLVVNAVRYTPPGGLVSVSWRRLDDNACFRVTDTGVGIEPEHIPRLTERFYRVDVGRSREKGGTGLGLAIVKHILLRHGARLKIESEPGKGSQFTCIFPPQRIHADN